MSLLATNIYFISHDCSRFINIGILLIMAVVCAIADSLIEQNKFPQGAPWLFDDNRPGDNPKINGLVTWANALIT